MSTSGLLGFILGLLVTYAVCLWLVCRRIDRMMNWIARAEDDLDALRGWYRACQEEAEESEGDDFWNRN